MRSLKIKICFLDANSTISFLDRLLSLLLDSSSLTLIELPSTSPCNSLPAPYTPTKQTLKN